MAIEQRSIQVLEQARTVAGQVESWADFSNAVFSPSGIVQTAFPNRAERLTFFDSRQCKEIHKIQRDLMERFGVAEGANPKSGKFVVRVPVSLHLLLELEARQERVSLNQLVVSKLSMPLSEYVREIVREELPDAH